MARGRKRAALVLGLVALTGYGCASTEGAAPLQAEREAGADEAPRAAEPSGSATPEDEDLSSDPYRKVPRGERESEPTPPQAPARFLSPSAAPEPAAAALSFPAPLSLCFVRRGRFAAAPRALLRLESALADVDQIEQVLSLSLPRGKDRDLSALAQEPGLRPGLLLVVELDPEDRPGSAYLVRTRSRDRAPRYLARFEPPRPRERPPSAALTHEGEFPRLVARLRRAHLALRQD